MAWMPRSMKTAEKRPCAVQLMYVLSTCRNTLFVRYTVGQVYSCNKEYLKWIELLQAPVPKLYCVETKVSANTYLNGKYSCYGILGDCEEKWRHAVWYKLAWFSEEPATTFIMESCIICAIREFGTSSLKLYMQNPLWKSGIVHKRRSKVSYWHFISHTIQFTVICVSVFSFRRFFDFR